MYNVSFYETVNILFAFGCALLECTDPFIIMGVLINLPSSLFLPPCIHPILYSNIRLICLACSVLS